MNFNSRPSVTVIDVARAAGVSVGTVSRVINGHSNISRANVERVQKAIGELGYEKCRSAEQLVSRRNGSRAQTGNIGMVYAEMGNDWASHPLVAAYSMGVEKACQEKGFHALIEFSGDSRVLPRCVRENKVDGLLVKATRKLPEYIANLPKDLPVVGVGYNDPAAEIQQVAPDNRGAGWKVADYLWSLGHRRIGFVSAEPGHPMFLARLQGYEAFLRAQGCFDPAICWLGDSDREGQAPETEPPAMQDAVSALLTAPGELVTAIIVANDWMARSVYSSLAKAGLRIPEDVSVVGFDNEPAVCTSLVPALTSYAVPFGDVAYAAALKVLERIQHPSELWDHSLHLIRGRIVDRASVMPAGAADSEPPSGAAGDA